jgi:hypothetical protein
MDEVTTGAIVLLAIGAVITYLATQHGRRIERFVRGDPGVRTTIEVHAPGERRPVGIETDPAVFEAGLPELGGIRVRISGSLRPPAGAARISMPRVAGMGASESGDRRRYHQGPGDRRGDG